MLISRIPSSTYIVASRLSLQSLFYSFSVASISLLYPFYLTLSFHRYIPLIFVFWSVIVISIQIYTAFTVWTSNWILHSSLVCPLHLRLRTSILLDFTFLQNYPATPTLFTCWIKFTSLRSTRHFQHKDFKVISYYNLRLN